VRAVGFMGFDELNSRNKLTTIRIILATTFHFLNDILQKPASGFYELPSADWALIQFLSAGVA
jgi:hypothetical protein